MTNNIRGFDAVSGEKTGILIHIEELLVFRFQLDLSPLGLAREAISSPTGRFIGTPPTWDEAVHAIQLSFDEAAVEAIAGFQQQYEPKPVTLPKTMDVDGVPQILPFDVMQRVRSKQEQYEQSRYSYFVQTVFGVVNQTLDQQFSFLPFVDGMGLKEMLRTIPVGDVVDESYLIGKQTMGREFFNACRASIRDQVGADWALVKYDAGLARHIRHETRQTMEIYEASLQL